MKIVADENIPYVHQLFSPLGEVCLVHGRSLAPAQVNDADVLLVRSVTKVNEALLQGSKVRFVGTCTIGTDHLDLAYLRERGIGFSSAPGCNANAVVQYVVAALAQLDRLQTRQKVAIVGCGNVGGRLYRALSAMGFDCCGVDPLLSGDTGMHLVEFEQIFSADIICTHTPLTRGGLHPTENLIDAAVLPKLKPGAVLLNAGRGEVVDNVALLDFLTAGGELEVVLDVWANEPAINRALFERVRIGTPHIAGYSFEGRVVGSLMIFDALSQFLAVDESRKAGIRAQVEADAFGETARIDAADLKQAITASYDIGADHAALGAALDTLPASFDLLRKHYPKRREFSHYHCAGVGESRALDALGFLPA